MQKLAPSKITSRNLHYRHSEDCWILHILSCAPRYKEAHWSDILCSNEQWEHVIVLQNHFTTWLDTTQANIGLPPTKRKSYHQLSWSPQENESSITYTTTRHVCSNYKASSGHSNTSCQETGTQANNKQGDDHPWVPRCFEGIGKFPGPDYHIQVDPSIPPKQTPCQPNPCALEREVPTRDKQDDTGRCTCFSIWSNPMD